MAEYRYIDPPPKTLSGKSWLIKAVAVARTAHAAHFGEPQEVYHLAKSLFASRRIHSSAWRWATERGLVVRKSLGMESITWPDGSHWTVSSTGSIWGASGSLTILDEAWAVDAEVVHDGIIPTMLQRSQPQMWLLSTANVEATGLMLEFRKKAMEGVGNTLIAEWSAEPGSDSSDPAVWEAASPHWSNARREMIDSEKGDPAQLTQYLNTWQSDEEAPREWPEGWSGCEPAPWFQPIAAAVEVSHDRSRYGVAAAARLEDGRIALRCASADSLAGATAILEGLGVQSVLAGVTLKDSFPGFVAVPFGQRETKMATAVMQDQVARGLVVHDHDPIASGEARAARTIPTEMGPMLSARRSEMPIPLIKAVTWVVFAIESGLATPAQVNIW